MRDESGESESEDMGLHPFIWAHLRQVHVQANVEAYALVLPCLSVPVLTLIHLYLHPHGEQGEYRQGWMRGNIGPCLLYPIQPFLCSFACSHAHTRLSVSLLICPSQAHACLSTHCCPQLIVCLCLFEHACICTCFYVWVFMHTCIRAHLYGSGFVLPTSFVCGPFVHACCYCIVST